MLERQRLFNEVIGAELRRGNGCGDRGVARNHDDVGLRGLFAQSAQCLDAVDAGQPDVQKHEIVGVLLDLLQALFAGGHRFS